MIFYFLIVILNEISYVYLIYVVKSIRNYFQNNYYGPYPYESDYYCLLDLSCLLYFRSNHDLLYETRREEKSSTGGPCYLISILKFDNTLLLE